MSRFLRKMIDIGPAGVIYPGSAQDYRYHFNRDNFRETATPWVRYWADWPSLQPDSRYAIDNPASPGYAKLQALDEQIRLACQDGLRVMLLPYRFPTWANGTAALNAQRNTDAEVSFEYWDRMTEAVWNRYVREGRNPAVYNPSRRALEYRLPADAYGPASAWARFFEVPLPPLPLRAARLGALRARLRPGQRAEPPAVAPARSRGRRGQPLRLGARHDHQAGRAADGDGAAGRGAQWQHHTAPRAVHERQRHGLEPPLHALERVRAGAAGTRSTRAATGPTRAARPGRTTTTGTSSPALPPPGCR